MFSAPDELDEDDEEMGGRAGKFEVGSDDDDDEPRAEKEPAKVVRRGSVGGTSARRGSTGGTGSGNVWDQEDGADGEEGRRGLLS